jgi:curved DNA-binding protein CbpA
MKLPDCYRILGLREGSSYEDIKASYRRLARQYHPDANPGDAAAQARFVRIATAYDILSKHVSPAPVEDWTGIENDLTRSPAQVAQAEVDQKLKQDIYQKLQTLLQKQRFPRAIALIEGLAQRLPEDGEIRQWQAITYQHWARHLLSQSQPDKARVYLKKALRLLPTHLELAETIGLDLARLERSR